jgi:AcrR family transcriptional regulator
MSSDVTETGASTHTEPMDSAKRRQILGGAREIFLARGFDAASMEEIARKAGVSKGTLYVYFDSKEALFTAVVMGNVAANVARFGSHVSEGRTIEERLASLGVTLLHWILVSDTVGLMRAGIAGAQRFPELASSVHQMACERGAGAVARLLGEVAQSGELGALPAFAPERLAATTRFFLDLVFLPLMIRALFGEKLELLRAEIEPHVAKTVACFLAACRHGGIS